VKARAVLEWMWRNPRKAIAGAIAGVVAGVQDAIADDNIERLYSEWVAEADAERRTVARQAIDQVCREVQADAVRRRRAN